MASDVAGNIAWISAALQFVPRLWLLPKRRLNSMAVKAVQWRHLPPENLVVVSDWSIQLNLWASFQYSHNLSLLIWKWRNSSTFSSRLLFRKCALLIVVENLWEKQERVLLTRQKEFLLGRNLGSCIIKVTSVSCRPTHDRCVGRASVVRRSSVGLAYRLGKVSHFPTGTVASELAETVLDYDKRSVVIVIYVAFLTLLLCVCFFKKIYCAVWRSVADKNIWNHNKSRLQNSYPDLQNTSPDLWNVSRHLQNISRDFCPARNQRKLCGWRWRGGEDLRGRPCKTQKCEIV